MNSHIDRDALRKNQFSFDKLMGSNGFKRVFTHHDHIRNFLEITYENERGQTVITRNDKIKFMGEDYSFIESDMLALLRDIKLVELNCHTSSN